MSSLIPKNKYSENPQSFRKFAFVFFQSPRKIDRFGFPKMSSEKPENEEEDVGYWSVMYDYEARDEDELSLEKGQLVLVLTKDPNVSGDEGWWCGQIGDKVNIFSYNYCVFNLSNCF